MEIVKRPWGKFEVIRRDEDMTAKIITVKPNQRSSLQTHKNRDEIWILLDGEVRYVNNSNLERLIKDEAVVISRGDKHRLIGGPSGGRIIEIWIGKSREEDIVRYKDDYGRAKFNIKEA